MLGLIKKVIALSGEEGKSIKVSVLTAFLFSIFFSLPYTAIYLFFKDLTEDSLSSKTIMVCVAIFAVSLLGGVITKIVTMRLQQCAGNKVAAMERLSIGDQLRRVSMGFFQEKNLGEVTTVLTTDISTYENIATIILEWTINGIIAVVVSCVILIIFDWHLGVLFLVVVLISLVLMNVIQKKSRQIVPEHKKAQTAAISATLEFIRGITVFKLFSMGGKNVTNTKKSYEEYSKAAYRLEMEVFLWNALLNCFLRIGMGGIILLAPYLTLKGVIPMATAILMIVASFQIFKPVEELVCAANSVRMLENAINRMEEIKKFSRIDEKSSEIKPKHYDISFDKVGFSYEGKKDVLRNVSFHIAENTMTAVIGASGSGKTTIARLIARFWDVQKGSIKIGGIDVKNVTCDILLDNMAIVFQNVYLFNDTIVANIHSGKPNATREEIVEAAKKARCHDFIMAMPDGYNTIVGEGGSFLSGGEKQRISIARAILKDAPIILLDEATSSIDPDNEVYIQQAINELVKNKTLIIIAHRLKTIRAADQILVMQDGELVESGTHEDLLMRRGQYQKFWEFGQHENTWRLHGDVIAK